MSSRLISKLFPLTTELIVRNEIVSLMLFTYADTKMKVTSTYKAFVTTSNDFIPKMYFLSF